MSAQPVDPPIVSSESQPQLQRCDRSYGEGHPCGRIATICYGAHGMEVWRCNSDALTDVDPATPVRVSDAGFLTDNAYRSTP